MVDLACYTVQAQFGVQGKSHIEDCGTGGQCQQFALRGEHHYFRGKQIEFKGIEKINGAWLGIVENILDSTQPCVEFRLLVALANFVSPVCGKAFFGNLVHASRAYLHFYPVAVGAHHSKVQGLVAVGLGSRNPVARTVGVQAVKVGYGRINIPAQSLFLGGVVTLKHNSHGIEVVHLLERYMLGFHLLPYGIHRFEPGLGLVLQT